MEFTILRNSAMSDIIGLMVFHSLRNGRVMIFEGYLGRDTYEEGSDLMFSIYVGRMRSSILVMVTTSYHHVALGGSRFINRQVDL